MFFIAQTNMTYPLKELITWYEELQVIVEDSKKLNINIDDNIETVMSKASVYMGQVYGLDPHDNKPKPPITIAVAGSAYREAALIIMVVCGGKSRAVIALQDGDPSTDEVNVNSKVTYLYTGSRMRSSMMTIMGKSVREYFNDPTTWLKYKTTYPVEYSDGTFLSFDGKESPYPCERQSEFIIRKQGDELNTTLRETFRKCVIGNVDDYLDIHLGRFNTALFQGITNTQRQVLDWWLNDHPDYLSNIEMFRELITCKNKVSELINKTCGHPKGPHTLRNR